MDQNYRESSCKYENGIVGIREGIVCVESRSYKVAAIWIRTNSGIAQQNTKVKAAKVDTDDIVGLHVTSVCFIFN